jgi:hypothetical protein
MIYYWFNGNTIPREGTNVSCSLKNTNEYQFDARTGASTNNYLCLSLKKPSY